MGTNSVNQEYLPTDFFLAYWSLGNDLFINLSLIICNNEIFSIGYIQNFVQVQNLEVFIDKDFICSCRNWIFRLYNVIFKFWLGQFGHFDLFLMTLFSPCDKKKKKKQEKTTTRMRRRAPTKINQKEFFFRSGIWHHDLTHRIKTSSTVVDSVINDRISIYNCW